MVALSGRFPQLEISSCIFISGRKVLLGGESLSNHRHHCVHQIDRKNNIPRAEAIKDTKAFSSEEKWAVNQNTTAPLKYE